ncbi:MAG TPA: CocE/NonD family hydrolase [Candidatus Limnocylindria bacterium]|nr:CocE/NonD family hydrolase [Candidatus Limnocylindria bacterium]
MSRVRSSDPPTRPQYPFDAAPAAREGSKPIYTIDADTQVRIPMRDGVHLAADVFRPAAPGRTFPALIAVSPYSRQLQRTELPDGQNEAGITEFWTPHGYAHVVVDVRGTNESEGEWDHMGPLERRDLVDIIEWVASQPWCDGRVGMTGESYFAWSQLMAAAERPPHLAAVFAQCASVDLYRDRYYHGGILKRGVASWFSVLRELNGLRDDLSGLRRHQDAILRMEHPFDGPYYQERLSWMRLDRVKIPTYVGGTWKHVSTHLRGAFEAWAGITGVPKRMFVGPGPRPRKPMAAYHREALRWYDHHLKGMDTGVMEGPPIQLFIQGAERWRSEREWPIARTRWRELFLGGRPGAAARDLADTAGPDGEAVLRYEPASREAYLGGPALVYRTEPFEHDLEVTGPLALTLWLASTATDTDVFATIRDEAPDGGTREITKGWLRASHRALDASRSKPWRPFHPHTASEPLVPNEAYELAVEIWPMSNLFRAGHRLRLEIAACDDQSDTSDAHQAVLLPATNRILEGRAHPSRLLVPTIPA